MSAATIEAAGWVRHGLIWRSTAPRPIDEDYESLRADRRRRHNEHVATEQQQRLDVLAAWWERHQQEEAAWTERAQREANRATYERWAA